MSRFIDPNRPYTDEEKEWLLTRAEGEFLILENDRRFAHLSKKDKAEATEQAEKDAQGEATIQKAIQEQLKAEEEDSYHPDDVAAVQPLTIAQLRQALEKHGQRTNVTEADKKDPEDPDDPFTEKEVLAYRLLNYLDEQRKLADKPQVETETETEGQTEQDSDEDPDSEDE
ncbi:hypothetical protein SEA_LITTLEFELLA_14 [Gordonia phage LittleFella]|nr:hypothetical protein SEA_LITTLEFELLA_14 [Gordonia phage LittleFella]